MYDREDLKQALDILYKGGLILYPTDTIWGIGCDATNRDAVARIYALKQREDSKSMLVLIDHPNRLQSYVREVPEIAWQLIEVADKPMTIIYPGARNLAANLMAPDGSVGIRITGEKFTEQLIREFRKPIVSTSANLSGKPAPAFFDEIDEAVRQGVDYIVRYRQEEQIKAVPSSILKIGLGGEIAIIRP
ncbi:MAG: threonylcarbamoyl-AMP synthase [Marinilabiliales bacterium]|nr:threonylcarbamoyl-AMP synthase [Marinilabiliales bacterium]